MVTGSPLKLKLQVYCGREIAMGPGKADLLEAIASHGSISAAAKAIGMSYRRAWQLVDVMNRCWQDALVEAVAGGSHERGARLTPLGAEVLQQYRALQADALCHVRSGFAGGLSEVLATSPRAARRDPD